MTGDVPFGLPGTTVETGWRVMMEVLVTRLADVGGVCSPIQVVVPLSSVKEYRPGWSDAEMSLIT